MGALITIAEANSFLNDEVYPEWDALEDPFKQNYINQASAHVQLSWKGPVADYDFDWTDVTTWDNEAETKDLIAQYADAVSQGMVYSQVTEGAASKAPIKKKTLKAASLETTTEYAQPDVAAMGRSTSLIDDQMLVLGFVQVSTGNSLTRV